MSLGLLLIACGGSASTQTTSTHVGNETGPQRAESAEVSREEPVANPRDVPLGWVEGPPLNDAGEPMVSSLEPDVLAFVLTLVDGTAPEPIVDQQGYAVVLEGAGSARNGSPTTPDPSARPDLSLPASCTPVFIGEQGSSRLAIQPAMTDQSEEEAAVIDAALALLREGIEVEAWCARSDEIEVDDPDPNSEGTLVERVVRAGAVWVVSIRNQKLQAWARLDGSNQSASPQR